MVKEKFKHIYLLVLIASLVICTIGSTYAYWAATASSGDRDVQTSSTVYSISMDIIPLYSDFTFIPMDNKDILKGLSNKCRDKYDRGACTAYKIHIYGYNPDLNFISGKMNTTLDNMKNLSYIMLEQKNEYNEEECVKIEEEIYCTAIPPTSVEEGIDLSLGDRYEVANTTEKNLILLIWLTNIEESQNEKDIGTFNSIVTFAMGSGGEIKGSISTVLQEDRDNLQSEE